MRALIEKLIYLARLERGETTTPQVVDVSAVVSRVVDAMQTANERAAIGVSAAAGALVVADEIDIGEAVRNLLDNALKYAPGTAITVTTAVDGDDVVLLVADRGPGMSEQDQAHAFDRFYRGRGDGDVDGSGLGLAIAKRAVERSEGTIALESRLGDGTRFTIRLPRAH
jgi:two-component system OmpR family sensor kinase